MLRAFRRLFTRFLGNKPPLQPPPGGRFVRAGTKNEFYTAMTSHKLRLQRGVRTERARDKNGSVVLMLQNEGGKTIGLQCRCPKGFTGGCAASAGEDDLGPIATCEGSCVHSEINVNVACGFFEVVIDNVVSSGVFTDQ